MRTALCVLLTCVLALSGVCGCTKRRKETIIEEDTTQTIERKPVISGEDAPSSEQSGAVEEKSTETREERVISREPVIE